MMRLGDYDSEFDDWFRIGLSSVGHVTREERLACTRKTTNDALNLDLQIGEPTSRHCKTRATCTQLSVMTSSAASSANRP
jgi:hypothetical protein